MGAARGARYRRVRTARRAGLQSLAEASRAARRNTILESTTSFFKGSEKGVGSPVEPCIFQVSGGGARARAGVVVQRQPAAGPPAGARPGERRDGRGGPGARDAGGDRARAQRRGRPRVDRPRGRLHARMGRGQPQPHLPAAARVPLGRPARPRAAPRGGPARGRHRGLGAALRTGAAARARLGRRGRTRLRWLGRGLRAALQRCWQPPCLQHRSMGALRPDARATTAPERGTAASLEAQA